MKPGNPENLPNKIKANKSSATVKEEFSASHAPKEEGKAPKSKSYIEILLGIDTICGL